MDFYPLLNLISDPVSKRLELLLLPLLEKEEKNLFKTRFNKSRNR